MKKYDLVIIGSGSSKRILKRVVKNNPDIKIAVVDKDEPGGICLTRGCVPSKFLIYPANIMKNINHAIKMGLLDGDIQANYFNIMTRMKEEVRSGIESSLKLFEQFEQIDYYRDTAEFVEPYIIKLNKSEEILKGDKIFLCTGSKPIVPPIKNIDQVGFLTSRDVLKLDYKPKNILIVGGGYVAAEFGHFFSSMGIKTTILGRNPYFLPEEEPEVSELVKLKLGEHVKILTNHEVTEAKEDKNKKILKAVERSRGQNFAFEGNEIVIATGRGPTNDIIKPEKSGVETEDKGWIKVNEYLETSQDNIWSFGDANGNLPLKHKANYETEIVYKNVFLKKKIKAEYEKIPHAVFTYPEVASVGLNQKQAVKKYGEENILVGKKEYWNTVKGRSMGEKHGFAKLIVNKQTSKILGASIIGSHASILIQEIVNKMYDKKECQDYRSFFKSIYINPALPQLIERLFNKLEPASEYKPPVFD